MHFLYRLIHYYACSKIKKLRSEIGGQSVSRTVSALENEYVKHDHVIPLNDARNGIVHVSTWRAPLIHYHTRSCSPMQDLPTPVESRGIEPVRNDLQRVIESLVELGLVAHDYPGDEPRSSQILQRKLQEFLADAKQVANSAEDVAQVHVPLDILTYLDHGRNPDIYSREFVELIAKQNQNIAGHMQALQQFETLLSQDIGTQFPTLGE